MVWAGEKYLPQQIMEKEKKTDTRHLKKDKKSYWDTIERGSVLEKKRKQRDKDKDNASIKAKRRHGKAKTEEMENVLPLHSSSPKSFPQNAPPLLLPAP
jgi:hypothetical protein